MELPGPERSRRLAEVEDEFPSLRREVERLLSEADAPSVLDAPAAQAFAALLEEAETPEPEDAAGQRVGPYRIVEEVGRGGMGVVYLAERVDGQFEQRVALKLVKRGLDTDEVLARFRRERQILARLEHRAIARLYDGGATEDGRPYFAMEHVVGEPITAWCDVRRLSIEDRLRLFLGVCEAVDYAHRHLVIHRDLKPSNVLVTAEGELKLLDFGVAKLLGGREAERDAPTLTRAGLRPMTPEYAAPEQIRGEPASAATDVYALGVVLYELLTGRRPYRLDQPYGAEVERTILVVEPPQPSRVVGEWREGEGPASQEVAQARDLAPAALRRCLAGDLDAIVLTALRKEPERRYASAQALAEDLRRHLEGRPVEARAQGWLYRAGRLVNRQRPRLTVLTGIALAVGMAVLLTLYPMARRVGTKPELAPELRLGSIRRLTSFPGLESEPTWSPDGRFVAFTSDVSGNKDLWIQPTTGGQASQLTRDPAEDGEPHWSPDGSTIVFRSRRGGGGLFTISPLGGEAVQVADFGYRPRWSPDGGRILFQSRAGNFIQNDIYVMDYPGGSPRGLLEWAPGKEAYRLASWSPDGKFIVCYSGGFVAPEGLFVQPMTPASRGFFLEWEGQPISGVDPVWSSQAAGIIFARNASGPIVDETTNLEFVPLDGTGHPAGTPARLTTAGDDDPALSRDGRRLAYTGAMASLSDVWKVALSPETGQPIGEPVRVTRGSALEEKPAVLPDGRHLLFLSNRDNGWFLYASDLDGRNVKLVDRSRTWTAISAIAPDGRWLVLQGTEINRSAPGSYLLPFDPGTLETSGPVLRLGDSTNLARSFSADAKYLTFSGYLGEPAITAWENPVGSDRRVVRWPLRADFLEEYPYLTHSYFSPDGNWLAFGAYKERHEPAVFVVRRGSDSPRLVLKGSGYPFWNNDARRIHIWSERGDATGGGLGFVEFEPATGAAGEFQRIELGPGRDVGTYDYWLAPDRRWLFFVAWENEGDIFVADLVQD